MGFHLSRPYILFILSILTILGVLSGWFLSGQPYTYTQTIQFTEAWEKRIVIPIITQITLGADSLNHNSFNVSLLYGGVKSDLVWSHKITIHPGEMFSSPLPLEPKHLSWVDYIYGFNFIWIHIVPASTLDNPATLTGTIEIEGRNWTLLERLRWEFPYNFIEFLISLLVSSVGFVIYGIFLLVARSSGHYRNVTLKQLLLIFISCGWIILEVYLGMTIIIFSDSNPVLPNSLHPYLLPGILFLLPGIYLIKWSLKPEGKV